MTTPDAQASTVRRQVLSGILMFIGMTFLWNYFRYQSFLGVIYPWELEVAPGVSAYALFIAVLCVLTVAALVVLGRRDLPCPPWTVFVVGVLGSVGVALSLACSSEGPELALPVACISTCLVAASFLTGYLAWASLCVRSLSMETVAVMAASFFASTLLGGLMSRVRLGAPEAFALLGPVLVGLTFWLARSRMPESSVSCDGRRLVFSAPVVLFVAFLLMGGCSARCGGRLGRRTARRGYRGLSLAAFGWGCVDGVRGLFGALPGCSVASRSVL